MVDKPPPNKAADWVALGVILLLAVYYGLTLIQVPFHPDESTHLYLSQDLSWYFRDPRELSWDGTLPLSEEERIRAIDAPLVNYVIGVARGILSTPALQADWNWSASWDENQDRGALPGAGQLLAARGSVALTLVAGLWFYYLALKRTLPAYASIAAVVLLGSNPLILLHGRRAMSEGILLFSLGLFMWAATRERRQPWLIGVAFALALNAKHTALGLLPAALYAVCLPFGKKPPLSRTASRLVQFGLVAAALTAFLNPFYWQRPLKALQVGLKNRISLSRQQEIDHYGGLDQGQLSLSQRATGIAANTFITFPQTEETGNYLAQTQETRLKYFSNPLHSWGRSLIPGGVLMVLSLTGIILMFKHLPSQSQWTRANSLIWFLSTLGTILILLLPLPWQRYVIPLLPLSAYWTISALVPLTEALRGKFSS